MKATHRKGNRAGRARHSLALWAMALAPFGAPADAAKPTDALSQYTRAGATCVLFGRIRLRPANGARKA